MPPPAPDEDAPARLHRALLDHGETVAAAESLTAGLFCATLASVPGASATLRGGAVVYATDLKATLVGVPQDVLDAHGAVSPQTAAALAVGVRDRCTAAWGVGLTGVAGPGPADGYGPGTVYLGIAGRGRTDVVRLDLPGGRREVRTGAVAAAVAELLARVEGGASPGKVDPGSGVTP